MAALRVDSIPINDSVSGVDLMAEEKEIYSLTEAAAYLDIHPETLRRMIKENRIAADMVIVDGRAQWQLKRADLENADVNPQGRPPKSNKTET